MRKRTLLFAASTGFAAIFVVELFFRAAPLLAEELPVFRVQYVFRTLCIALSSGCLVYGLSCTVRSAGTGIRDARVVIPVTCIYILPPALFLLSPSSFSRLSLEDNYIEVLSAVLCFVACGFFICTWRRMAALHMGLLYRVTACAAAVLAFVIGMEEVSWLQRVLSIQTPGLFENNLQNEFNLHNFATGAFETSYYFFAFIFFILLSFVGEQSALGDRNRYLFVFVPSMLVLVSGAVSTAYSYDMWNILFMQTAFFATLAILLFYAVRCEHRRHRICFLILVLLQAATQIVFLTNGIYFVRLWDVTEYREFFISLVLMIYAWEVWRRTARFERSAI